MNVITFRFGKKLNDWVNTVPEKTIWMLKAENMVSAYSTDSSGIYLLIQWGQFMASNPRLVALVWAYFACADLSSVQQLLKHKGVRMSRSLVLLFIVIFLTGCSATGPRYSEHKSTIPALSSESSRIFFFRNSRFMSGGSDAEIYINDKKVGECADDAYFFTDTIPGLVKIKAETFGTLGSHEVEKELEGGNEYYSEILVNTAYVYSSVFVGVIGQVAYAGSNENANGWIFKEVKREEAIPQLTDKIFSLDGE